MEIGGVLKLTKLYCREVNKPNIQGSDLLHNHFKSI